MSVLTLDQLVDELAERCETAKLSGHLEHRAYLPQQATQYGELSPPLPDELARALEQGGVQQLFSHQCAGIEAIREGKNVLVTTPTASGKSLIFQLPILEEAAKGGPGKALFLFPLKALGQDQHAKFEAMREAAGLSVEQASSAIYDGDTPRKQREQIRQSPPRVLISNPDMLHYGILGSPGPWAPLFKDLKWIVLDELHTYRGIFGSHFHHVLRRLLRLCKRHGSEPKIIASSATAQNAAEFASLLTQVDFEVLDQSGAPREGRHFLLFQPETSPYTTALQLLIHFVEQGLKTIVFTKARRITELLHQWLRQQAPELAPRVANYRAGFLSQERRQIEQELFEGKLDGVISTSALEMGIDVGGLDACILVGFPGSMMATWQRSGRVGRNGRESLTALIALPDALDQYLLQQPEQFLSRDCEPLMVGPGNEAIASRHLLCAAAEMPLQKKSDANYLSAHAPLVGDMLRDFDLKESESGEELYCNRKQPHRQVSLRGSGSQYDIRSETTGKTIGTVDAARVFRECHPGAVYLHRGRQHFVLEVDTNRRQVLVQAQKLDYFTTPLTEKETDILEVLETQTHGPLQAWLGRVLVTERVVGYERKRMTSLEKLGSEALELPPNRYETVALWFAAPRAIEETVRDAGEDFMGSLHAGEHAAISLFPVLALCDRGDLGGISIPFHEQVGCGAIFIYDGHPGGVGIAKAGFEKLPELLARVGELLDGCDCEDGCPMCIQSPKCGNGNRPLDKAGARHLVRLLLGEEKTTQPVESEAIEIQPKDPATESEVEAAGDESGEQVFRHGQADAPTGGPKGRRQDLFDLGIPRKRRELTPASSPPSTPARGPSREANRTHRPSSSSRNESHAVRSARSAGTRHGERRPQRRLGPPIRRAAWPRTIERTILFDVETKRSAKEVGGWHQLHRLGVAMAVACDLEEGELVSFGENDVQGLVEMLKSADLVVGFNIMGFDYPVLSGYVGEDLRRNLPTLDLLESIRETTGKRLGLSHLAQATLGIDKSADGLQSLEWYKEGRLDLIEDYCRQDVEVMRELYLFGRREGYVCYREKPNNDSQSEISWEDEPDEPNARPDLARQGDSVIGSKDAASPEPLGRILRLPVDWP